MIETYLQKVANLRTDKARDRYPASTLHRAPHKPFLLLSVMDLIAQGVITEDFIKHLDSKIILIDVQRLAELMIEHNIGVSSVASYEIKRNDSDYYIEE